jgi:hypothetical protein
MQASPTTSWATQQYCCIFGLFFVYLQIASANWNFFYIFLIILQNYTSLENLSDLTTNRRAPWRPPWATTVAGPTAIAHDGWANGRVPNGREGQPLWATVIGPATVGHGGRSPALAQYVPTVAGPTAIAHGGWTNCRVPNRRGPPW